MTTDPRVRQDVGELLALARQTAGDPAALLEQIEGGWTSARWTQREAREWWDTRAPAMLAARRAAEESVSRGPKRDVDVASRVRSESLPELSLDAGTQTAVRPQVGDTSREK